jgi:membrane protease YdiL (CAAX protease family)
MIERIREKVRPVALTILAPAVGFLLVMVLKHFAKIEISKLTGAIINLLVVAPIAFVLFPRKLGIPFGRIKTRDFLRKVGFYLPDHVWKHIVLGLILAACNLAGMLVASILTGRYTMDISTINLPHFVFCLNPGLWEELFWRGVLMLLLLKLTRSLKKAFVIQVVLFGLGHLGGVNVEALFEAFSVMIIAIGFTYVAYKTNSLVAAIVFHYFHDALLFFVQLPKGIYHGVYENALFYAFLWPMIGIGCVITKFAADKLGVKASTELYVTEAAA